MRGSFLPFKLKPSEGLFYKVQQQADKPFVTVPRALRGSFYPMLLSLTLKHLGLQHSGLPRVIITFYAFRGSFLSNISPVHPK
jgi:hypothetical protein